MISIAFTFHCTFFFIEYFSAFFCHSLTFSSFFPNMSIYTFSFICILHYFPLMFLLSILILSSFLLFASFSVIFFSIPFYSVACTFFSLKYFLLSLLVFTFFFFTFSSSSDIFYISVYLPFFTSYFVLFSLSFLHR